jgi:hypothetical protein
LKTYLKEHLNEKISDHINRIAAHADPCFGSRRAFGIGKSKPFTRRHRRNGARGRPKSGDGYHA